MELERIAREAFKAGWKERDRTPGLKRRVKRNLDNAIRSMIGGGRFNDVEYVPDHRTYHSSIWLNSAFRKGLAQAGVTRMGGDGEAGSVAEGHSTRSRSDAPISSSPSPSTPEIPQ